MLILLAGDADALEPLGQNASFTRKSIARLSVAKSPLPASFFVVQM